jgi:hypothetical protein
VTWSSWIVGAKKIAAQTLTFGGGPQVVAAGTYYLRDASAGLSLIEQVRLAMNASGATGTQAVITLGRRVRLSASGTFSITWPADGVLRDALGFTGNLAAAATYTAPNCSPLLWSPAVTGSPQLSPLYTAGVARLNAFITVAEDGTTSGTVSGSRTYQRYSFRYVPGARVYPKTGDTGGSWVRAWSEFLGVGGRFKYYPAIDEVDGSSTATTWPTALGPYSYTPASTSPTWSYERSNGFQFCDDRADVELPCHVIPEVT